MTGGWDVISDVLTHSVLFTFAKLHVHVHTTSTDTYLHKCTSINEYSTGMRRTHAHTHTCRVFPVQLSSKNENGEDPETECVVHCGSTIQLRAHQHRERQQHTTCSPPEVRCTSELTTYACKCLPYQLHVYKRVQVTPSSCKES